MLIKMAKLSIISWSLIIFLWAQTNCQTSASTVCCKEKGYESYDYRYHNHMYETKCTLENVDAPEFAELVFSNCNYLSQRKYLYFLNSSVFEFPRKLFKSVSQIDSLNMENCGLTKMNRFSFEYAPQLTNLHLMGNNLSVLEFAVFSEAAKIQVIDLSFNKITEIDEKAFMNLENLVKLNLSNNEIKQLKNKVFQPLSSLQTIDLSNNSIEVFEADLFQNNSQLTSVMLDRNQITILEGVSFKNLNNLNVLNLSSNHLKEFKTIDLSAQIILLDNNEIEEFLIPATAGSVSAINNSISRISCAENSRVTHLNLEGNKLTKLGCISNFTGLEELSMSSNKLGSLSLSAFASMRKLKKLNLDFTEISAPEFGTFSHIDGITHLDISYNKFQEIDLNVMAGLKKLQYLFIDGNNLTEFEYKSVRVKFPDLIEIGIADNSFNCSYLAQIVDEFNSKKIAYISSNLVKVSERPNVNGIACINEKYTKNIWKLPIKHASMGSGNYSEDMQAMNTQINGLIDNVNILNKSSEALNVIKTEQRDLSMMMQKLHAQMQEQAQQILQIKLSILTNNTNQSNLSSDLKSVIEQMNNITMERQKLNNDVMQHKLNEVAFQVEKNSMKLMEHYNQINFKTNANERMTQALRRDHPVPRASETNAAGVGLVNVIILVLNIIIVFVMLAAGVAYYMRKRFIFPQDRMSRTTTRTFDTQLMEEPL